MDSALCNDLENSLVLLTPSRPFSKDMKSKVYKRNTFFDMMSAFRYRRQAETNSKAVQFDAKEKIQSGLMQMANTETQHSGQNDASTQTASPDFCSVRAAETQTTNSICENNCADSIGEQHSEKCDVGLQVNMVQTGVVRPVVRRAANPEDTEKSLSGNSRQRERSQESANRRNEKFDDMKASVEALHSHLKKLQNLVTHEAREKPTRNLNLMDNYLNHICTLSNMIINSSELGKVLEFSRSAESKFFKHGDRMCTQTLIGEKYIKNERKRTMSNASLTNAENQSKHSKTDHRWEKTSVYKEEPCSSTRPDRKATLEHVSAHQYHRNKFLQNTNHTRDRNPAASHKRHEQYDHRARRNRDARGERASLHLSELGSLPSRIDQRRQMNRYDESPCNRERRPRRFSSSVDPRNAATRSINHKNMRVLNARGVAESKLNRQMRDEIVRSERFYSDLAKLSRVDRDLRVRIRRYKEIHSPANIA